MASSSAEGGVQAAYAKAVELLARRTHFRAELARKLAARGFSEQEVAGALDRLAGEGHLDDGRAAREFSHGAATRKGYGPRRLRAELAARGVGDEDAAAAVTASFADGELAHAAAEAQRFRGDDPAALARRLDRKGYSRAVILEIVRRFERGLERPA